MNKIHLLPAHEAQKIAAGEVIERPAHIIKELLENALDAGATKIDIYLEQAGKKLIRIVDNGSGMSPDDARLCFVKHATSKVTSLDDLEHISSFGFRGEALASIAAVSRTTLKTNTNNTDGNTSLGIEIDYEQGNIIREQAIAYQTGTEFIVQDLFYNMPARRKFLRQDETEINQVNQLINAASLSHLNVNFRFYVDNKLVLNAPANNNLSERITQLWGYNTAQNLVPMLSPLILRSPQGVSKDNKHSWVSITGAVSQNSFWRHGRDRIFFFVNNRWIKNNELSKAVLKGYANALPPAKFPMAFIFITIDPSYVDINVHPKKEEVRFLKPGIIETLLQKSVQQALENQITQLLSASTQEFIPAPEPIFSGQKSTSMPREFSPSFPGFSMPSFFRQPQEVEPNKAAMTQNDTLLTTNDDKQIFQNNPKEVEKTHKQDPLVPRSQQGISKDLSNPTYTIMGQLFNTYIVLEKTDECIIIDQHAAHERILYEQWKSNFEGLEGISLLFPEVITIPEHQVAMIMQAQDIFAKLGITLEQFGKQELIIKSSPPKIQGTNLSNTIKEAAIFIEEHNTLDENDLRKKLYEHIHSHMACKAAVRAGDTLTPSMIKQLINDLLTVENRFQCVHGRPTMWTITKLEFEKKFRRC